VCVGAPAPADVRPRSPRTARVAPGEHLPHERKDVMVHSLGIIGFSDLTRPDLGHPRPSRANMGVFDYRSAILLVRSVTDSQTSR
jgi:hypothetical protein